MNRLVAADPDRSSQTNLRRGIEWALWPIAASLLCVAIFASAPAGCGNGLTGGRDAAVLGAAIFTGLATAVTLWRSLRLRWALAISLAVSLAVVGFLVFLDLLFWIHHCAN
jgi:hypothetical protein